MERYVVPDDILFDWFEVHFQLDGEDICFNPYRIRFCKDCGLAVIDTRFHDEFHNSIENRLDDIEWRLTKIDPPY